MTKQTFTAFRFALIVTLGGFVFGLDAAIISGTIRYITANFNLTDMQLGTVVSAPSLGAIIGLFFAGRLADWLGRKKALFAISLVYLVSAIGSALATSFEILLVARFIGGLSFISISLTSMYIGEISPSHLRGKLVSFNQLMIVIGLSSAYYISYGLVQLTGEVSTSLWGMDVWRIMFATEVVPVLIWATLLLTVCESPRWLFMQGRHDEAKATLERLNSQAEAEQAYSELAANVQAHSSEIASHQPLKHTFEPKYRKVLLLGIAIAIAQGFTGMNAILFYAPVVFEQLGSGVTGAFEQTTYIGMVSLVFTLISIYLVDRLGRRPLMLIGLAMILASHLVCWYGFSHASYNISQETVANIPAELDASKLAPYVGQAFDSDIALKETLKEVYGHTQAKLVEGHVLQSAVSMNSALILFGILAFIAAFHLSIGPIMWVLISEISPNAIRSVTIPLFALATSIASYLIQHFFPWQLSTMGAAGTFFTYAAFAVVSLLIVLRYLPETKNKTIEAIERALVVEK